MEFLTGVLYLQQYDVIKVENNYYMYCGFAKSSMIKRANSDANYAYKSEIYLLSRTILPQFKDIGLVDILGGGAAFLSLNEDMYMDIDSRFRYLKLAKDSYVVVGRKDKEEFDMWQRKMKLFYPERHTRSFFSNDEALQLILSSNTYKIDKEKDRELLDSFYDLIVGTYAEINRENVKALKETLNYVPSKRNCLENYPYNLPYVIRYTSDEISFFKKSKYRNETELYGKCSIWNVEEFLVLFLQRNLAKRTRLRL